MSDISPVSPSGPAYHPQPPPLPPDLEALVDNVWNHEAFSDFFNDRIARIESILSGLNAEAGKTGISQNTLQRFERKIQQVVQSMRIGLSSDQEEILETLAGSRANDVWIAIEDRLLQEYQPAKYLQYLIQLNAMAKAAAPETPTPVGATETPAPGTPAAPPEPPAPQHPTPPGVAWLAPIRINPPPDADASNLYITCNHPFYYWDPSTQTFIEVLPSDQSLQLSNVKLDGGALYIYVPGSASHGDPTGISGVILISNDASVTATAPPTPDKPAKAGIIVADWEYAAYVSADGQRRFNIDYTDVNQLMSSGAISFWPTSASTDKPVTYGSTIDRATALSLFSKNIQEYGPKAGWSQAMIDAAIRGVGQEMYGVAPKFETFYQPIFNSFFIHYLQQTLFNQASPDTIIGKGIKFPVSYGTPAKTTDFYLTGFQPTGDGNGYLVFTDTADGKNATQTFSIPTNYHDGMAWFSGGLDGEWAQYASQSPNDYDTIAAALIRDMTIIVNLGMTYESMKATLGNGTADIDFNIDGIKNWVSTHPDESDRLFYQQGVPYNVYEQAIKLVGLKVYAFDYDECTGTSSDMDYSAGDIDHISISWGSWTNPPPLPDALQKLVTQLSPQGDGQFTGAKLNFTEGLISWIVLHSNENITDLASDLKKYLDSYLNPADFSNDLYYQYFGLNLGDVIDIYSIIKNTLKTLGIQIDISPPVPTAMDNIVMKLGAYFNHLNYKINDIPFISKIISEIYLNCKPTDDPSTTFIPWLQQLFNNPDNYSNKIFYAAEVASLFNVKLDPAAISGSTLIDCWKQGTNAEKAFIQALEKDCPDGAGECYQSTVNNLGTALFTTYHLTQNDVMALAINMNIIPPKPPPDLQTLITLLSKWGLSSATAQEQNCARYLRALIENEDGWMTLDEIKTQIQSIGQNIYFLGQNLYDSNAFPILGQYDVNDLCSALGISSISMKTPSIAALKSDMKVWLKSASSNEQKVANDILNYIATKPTPTQLQQYIQSIDLYTKYGLTINDVVLIYTDIFSYPSSQSPPPPLPDSSDPYSPIRLLQNYLTSSQQTNAQANFALNILAMFNNMTLDQMRTYLQNLGDKIYYENLRGFYLSDKDVQTIYRCFQIQSNTPVWSPLPLWKGWIYQSLIQLDKTAGVAANNLICWIIDLLNSSDAQNEMIQAIKQQIAQTPAEAKADVFFDFLGITQTEAQNIFKAVSMGENFGAPTQWDTILSNLMNVRVTTPQGISVRQALINYILSQPNPSATYSAADVLALLEQLAKIEGLKETDTDYSIIEAVLNISWDAVIGNLLQNWKNGTPAEQAFAAAVAPMIGTDWKNLQDMQKAIQSWVADIYTKYGSQLTINDVQQIYIAINLTAYPVPKDFETIETDLQAWKSAGTDAEKICANALLSLIGNDPNWMTLLQVQSAIQQMDQNIYTQFAGVTQADVAKIYHDLGIMNPPAPPLPPSDPISALEEWIRNYGYKYRGARYLAIAMINELKAEQTKTSPYTSLHDWFQATYAGKDVYFLFPGLSDGKDFGYGTAHSGDLFAIPGIEPPIDIPTASALDQARWRIYDDPAFTSGQGKKVQGAIEQALAELQLHPPPATSQQILDAVNSAIFSPQNWPGFKGITQSELAEIEKIIPGASLDYYWNTWKIPLTDLSSTLTGITEQPARNFIGQLLAWIGVYSKDPSKDGKDLIDMLVRAILPNTNVGKYIPYYYAFPGINQSDLVQIFQRLDKDMPPGTYLPQPNDYFIRSPEGYMGPVYHAPGDIPTPIEQMLIDLMKYATYKTTDDQKFLQDIVYYIVRGEQAGNNIDPTTTDLGALKTYVLGICQRTDFYSTYPALGQDGSSARTIAQEIAQLFDVQLPPPSPRFAIEDWMSKYGTQFSGAKDFAEAMIDELKANPGASLNDWFQATYAGKDVYSLFPGLSDGTDSDYGTAHSGDLFAIAGIDAPTASALDRTLWRIYDDPAFTSVQGKKVQEAIEQALKAKPGNIQEAVNSAIFSPQNWPGFKGITQSELAEIEKIIPGASLDYYWNTWKVPLTDLSNTLIGITEQPARNFVGQLLAWIGVYAKDPSKDGRDLIDSLVTVILPNTHVGTYIPYYYAFPGVSQPDLVKIFGYLDQNMPLGTYLPQSNDYFIRSPEGYMGPVHHAPNDPTQIEQKLIDLMGHFTGQSTDDQKFLQDIVYHIVWMDDQTGHNIDPTADPSVLISWVKTIIGGADFYKTYPALAQAGSVRDTAQAILGLFGLQLPSISWISNMETEVQADLNLVNADVAIENYIDTHGTNHGRMSPVAIGRFRAEIRSWSWDQLLTTFGIAALTGSVDKKWYTQHVQNLLYSLAENFNAAANQTAMAETVFQEALNKLEKMDKEGGVWADWIQWINDEQAAVQPLGQDYIDLFNMLSQQT